MTPQDLEILLSSNITSLLRLDLLDTDFIKMGEIQGYAISISPSVSASSDIRRTCSLTMHIEHKKNLSSMSGMLWLNNLIQVYHGVKIGETTTWYLMGSYLLSENSYVYDATTQTLSMSLVDMMAAATEIRGSQIGGAPLMIPAGSSIRGALISTIAMFSPFKRYSVVEFEDVVPYDLEFDVGVYPYEVLKTLMDLFPLYQMYYSVDGVFTVEQIPHRLEDSVEVSAEVMEHLIVSESRQNSFRNVKNTTEIFGMSLDAGYTASECTTVGNAYVLDISTEFEVLEANSTYSFTPNANSIAGQKIKIQSLPEYPIYVNTVGGGEAPIGAGEMLADVMYVVKYLGEKFYLQGESDIHVIVQEVSAMPTSAQIEAFKEDNNCRDVFFIVNPDSPFAADKVGEIRQVLKDGEFANIYTTTLAIERAKWENYKTTRLQDTVELKCKIIPFLDVNQKIAYYGGSSGNPSTLLGISDMGELVSNDRSAVDAIYAEVNPNGELVITEGSGFPDSIFADVEFEIDENGDLVVYNLGAPETVCITEDISYDFNTYTMTVRASVFYSYYPF